MLTTFFPQATTAITGIYIYGQWTSALLAPDLTAFWIQQPGYFGPKILQAFTMLIFPDLTTPDFTAKPDLQALFLDPIERLSSI